MNHSVLIIGGFDRAAALANSLVESGYGVTIINKNYKDCLSLAENNKINVMYGDGTKPYVLEDAEAGKNESVIALTQSDEDNLLICQLCKKRFGIRKSVALVSDPKKMEFFYQMGIDSVVCASSEITGIIKQHAFLDEIATMLPIGSGDVCISEVMIQENAPSEGKKIWEINLPKDVIVGCILRKERSMVPRGDTRLLAGDTLVLISTQDHQRNAIRELTGRAML